MALEHSDHCPLLLGLLDNKVGRRRFHFESFWTKIDGLQWAVAAAVPTSSCPYLSVSQKFKATARGLQRWSNKTVGNLKFQLGLAWEIFHQFEIAQDNQPLSPGELWLKNNLKKHSLALASLSRTIDRLRSRIGWLREGDANTMLFHLHALHRKTENLLVISFPGIGSTQATKTKLKSLIISMKICLEAAQTGHILLIWLRSGLVCMT
jgi:hypothetical protein